MQPQIDNYEAQMQQWQLVPHQVEQPQIVQRDQGGGGGGGGITRAEVLALDRRNNDGASKNPYWSKDATSPAICVTGLLELLEQPCWTCNLPAPQSCTV
jgi:hypothetical protein